MALRYCKQCGCYVPLTDKNWNRPFKLNAYVLRSPENRARYLMKRAIELGWMVRRPCEVCGNSMAEGHHVEYSEPYNVHWLCREHHGIADRWRENGEDYARSKFLPAI